jgi:predicted ATPase
MPEKFYFIQDQQVSNPPTALEELNEIISLDKRYEDYTLIWKLPETGLLPQKIIEIISGLKELSKNHQIIISTNSYFLLKELEIQIEEPINYICIHKDGVETSTSIYDLEHEPIISAYVDQYKRSIGGIM